MPLMWERGSKDIRAMQSHKKLQYGHFKFQKKPIGSLTIYHPTLETFSLI